MKKIPDETVKPFATCNRELAAKVSELQQEYSKEKKTLIICFACFDDQTNEASVGTTDFRSSPIQFWTLALALFEDRIKKAFFR